MKRLFTFALLLLALTSVRAQSTDHSFVFIDHNGNEIADGATIEVTDTTMMGDVVQMNIPVGIKNVAGKMVGGRLRHTNPSDMPNGAMQVCAFDGCSSSDEVSIGNACEAGYVNEDISTEWKPTDFKKSWTATFRIEVMQTSKNFVGFDEVKSNAKVLAYGPTLNVHFAFKGTTGISGVKTDTASKVVARYAADGTLLTAPAKGLNILRLANGRTVKVVVK